MKEIWDFVKNCKGSFMFGDNSKFNLKQIIEGYGPIITECNTHCKIMNVALKMEDKNKFF